MVKHNQVGAVNGLVISFVLTIVLLIGALGFGGWALSSRNDYKDNVDKKVTVAVEEAKQAQSIAKDKEFAELAKQPLKTYGGPQSYGSLHVEFPKTWSGYADDSGKAATLVDGYFSPGVVPSLTDQGSVFALRVQVLGQPYSRTLEAFANQQQAGKLTISAYALPKLPKVVGVKVTGELADKKNVTMVVLPLRSQTIQLWTEGSQYLGDFNDIILPNFSFIP